MIGVEEMSLRKEVRDLYYSISADVEHGECFYDLEMLNEFCARLDMMKDLAQKYYKENQEEGTQ